MESGTKLGHYEIGTLLGKGGMGEVWRARDTKLGREVAVSFTNTTPDWIDTKRANNQAESIDVCQHNRLDDN